ncbi:hypothetical protein [Salinibacterium sp. ZJ70]|uniref:hypothetical protein n=1 Tax=Salinibacterium sp. ZJ70 TaxID=2708084 RepID=UPI001421D3A5|nr:hypothetical protein [Salinibacterium sp. ZJ70]
MNLDNRLWGIITAFICIGTLALGWFVGVEPRLAGMARAADAAENTTQQNELARLDIARMTEATERIDELRAELAQLRRAVPAGVDGTGFITALDGLIAAHGVSLKSVVFGTPEAYSPPTGEGAPLTDPAVTSENMVVVSVSVTVAGANENVLSFMNGLQRADRLVAVTGVTKSNVEETVELTVDGTMFVMRDPLAEAALDASDEAAAEG